jgi:hypothetical protein
MSALLNIKGQKAQFLQKLNSLIEEAASSAHKVAAACANIQRVYRGRVDRAYIRYKSDNVNTIQRVFRGHIGRRLAADARGDRNEKRLASFFTYFVMQLQRCFRGYYSRKYRSNHADRKKFIGDLEETGRKVREMMFNYSVEQAAREEQEAREKAGKDFEKYASNLHHLVSTKQIRGVFNPPEEYMETPTWRNAPVEDHVRNTIRDLLRTRGISKTGLVMDINGTRKVPYVGLKSRLSLQASAPYDMLTNDTRRKAVLHELITRGKGSFFAGGRTNIINHDDKPLSVGDPYVDANRNPLLKKGVPASQAQLLESARTQKVLFQPKLDRPFYSRTGGNRSAVNPNDIFDVIGDAQASGGVTQRALGTTSRFGVPDNCDYRPPGGVLPEPPLRASTLRITRPRVTKLTVRAKPINRLDSVGLSGVAKYDNPARAGDSKDGGDRNKRAVTIRDENNDDYYDGDDPEDDERNTPYNYGSGSGNGGGRAKAEIVDPFASSDED